MVMMQDGVAPLSASAGCGQIAVVKVLLKNRANIEAASKVRVRGSVFWGMVLRVEDVDWVVQMMTMMMMTMMCVICLGCSD